MSGPPPDPPAHGLAPVRRPWPDLRLTGAAAGAWIATALVLHATVGAGIATAAVAACLAALVAAVPRLPPALAAARWPLAGVAIGVACGAASTAAHLAVAHAQPVAGLARQRATVTATLTLTGDPHPVGSGYGPPTYGVEADLTGLATATSQTTLDVRVFVLASADGWLGLLPGQRLRARGRLAVPDPGTLDAALLSVATPPRLLGSAPWPQRAAGSLRAGLQRACDGLPAGVRGLLPGLIDGDTTHLDPAISDAFRATGMTHLVAVSGSNVAMILGAVLLVARWCRAGPFVAAVVCALALVGFVVLVRPSPSVLRAAAMGGLGLIALATGRARSAVPALAAVVAALVLYDPALATDVGFALSAFATAGLLLIAPGWRDALRHRGVPAGLAEAVAVPAAAQVACSPLIAGVSGTVSLVAVPANLLAVPVVPAATIVGVAAAVCSPVWPTGAAFLAWLASWPARWLILVAECGATAPAAVAAWPGGLWGALLLAAVLSGALFVLRHRTARLVAVVGVLAALAGAVPVRLVAGGWPPAGALLVACDVGQGDGLVLPLGGGAGIVVDTGPEPTAIDGCLRRLGIDRVPLLVLTHFHADHVGGVTGVLDGRRVGAILTSPFPQPPEGYREVVVAAAARHIPLATPTYGQVIVVGPVRLTVLGPVSRLTGTRSDPNNNSLVIRADEDGTRLLLTGDAEIEEQVEVLATAGASAVRADVLKMPHHGSAYQSAAFLAAVHPAVVLVSVGVDNEYGLPNVPTLDRLAAGGARVLRTDLDGDLAAVRDADGLAVAVRGRPPGQRR